MHRSEKVVRSVHTRQVLIRTATVPWLAFLVMDQAPCGLMRTFCVHAIVFRQGPLGEHESSLQHHPRLELFHFDDVENVHANQ